MTASDFITIGIEGIDTNLSFSNALEHLKSGQKMARSGWNGKGMFVYLVSAGNYPAKMPSIQGVFKDDEVPYGAYLAMKTAQGFVVPWLASQTDLLENDWYVVGEE